MLCLNATVWGPHTAAWLCCQKFQAGLTMLAPGYDRYCDQIMETILISTTLEHRCETREKYRPSMVSCQGGVCFSGLFDHLEFWHSKVHSPSHTHTYTHTNGNLGVQLHAQGHFDTCWGKLESKHQLSEKQWTVHPSWAAATPKISEIIWTCSWHLEVGENAGKHLRDAESFWEEQMWHI